MSDPLVSVLLPCRNGGRTLGLAMLSILEQSFPDFEILLINDGSTDDSLDVARAFNDPRIRILGDAQGRGLAQRLNEGVRQARGRYVARMDADDVSFAQRFELQLKYLEAHPEVDLVGCRAIVFRESGEVVGLLPFAREHESLCAQPWRNIPLAHPGWMGRRSWFEAHPYRIPEVARAEDQELLLRSCRDSRYACLDDVLLGYRQGAFQLKRTLLARRALLAAQLGIFYRRREWANCASALAVSLLKVTVDCLAALPGSERFFFFRMSEPVDQAVIESLRKRLDPAGEAAR